MVLLKLGDGRGTIIRAPGQYAYVGENDVALQVAINAHYFGERGRLPQPVVKDTLARYGAFAGVAASHIVMQWDFRSTEFERRQPLRSDRFAAPG